MTVGPGVLLGTQKLECECDRTVILKHSVGIDWEEGTLSILEDVSATFMWIDLTRNVKNILK
jgi:hypothetical protein